MNQSSNSNQNPDPDDSVHQLLTETSSYDFSNQIDTDCKSKTEPLLQENDDSVDQLEAQTSFEFSNLQIDANCRPETEHLVPESLESPETDDSVDKKLKTEQLMPESPEIKAGINHLLIKVDNHSKSTLPHDFIDQKSKTEELMPESPENDASVEQSTAETNDSESPEMTSSSQKMTSASLESDDEDEDEDDEDGEGEFTFMYVGDNDLPDAELFESGQIRFPLFDQSLLSTGDNRLPITVPVDNVFIESPRRSNGESDGISTGTVCALSKDSESGSPEINIKSNSTGFSKLWRFRDNMNRSNSDGRDAFVFFQNPTSSSSNGKVNGVSEVNGKVNRENDGATGSSSNGKVNGVKVVDGKSKGKITEKAVKKGKKKVKSAHEVYLKQKGGKTEDERRKSYLPYRPGLMGFFTNVNGGLSKNVHPF